ncbi:MAG TPA: hypothetical protein VJ728_10235, partial [Candidatus Binataceae bacterium]|nr:hypothetical protein [Candidatus Binataceae bacterium]
AIGGVRPSSPSRLLPAPPSAIKKSSAAYFGSHVARQLLPAADNTSCSANECREKVRYIPAFGNNNSFSPFLQGC